MRKINTLNLSLYIHIVLVLLNPSIIKADDLNSEKKFYLINYFDYDYAKKNEFQRSENLKYKNITRNKNIIEIFLNKNPDKNNFYFKRKINLNLKLRDDELCNKDDYFLKAMFFKKKITDIELISSHAQELRSKPNKNKNLFKKEKIEYKKNNDVLSQDLNSKILRYIEIIFNKVLNKNNLYDITSLNDREVILTYKIKVPPNLSNYNELEFDLPNEAKKYFHKINLRFNTHKVIEDIQSLKFNTQEFKNDDKKDDLNVIYIQYKLPSKSLSSGVNGEINYSYLNKIIFSKISFDADIKLFKSLKNYHALYNNYFFYDLKILMNSVEKKNELMLIDIHQCIIDLKPILTQHYNEIDLKKYTKEQIKFLLNDRLDQYFVNINNKFYNIDQIIFDGDEFNNSKSDKNFFLTSLSRSEFLELKNLKVKKFNHFLGDKTVYLGSLLIDDNFNEFQINSDDVKIKKKLFYYLIFITFSLILILLPILNKKKIKINKKIYNFFYGVLLLIFIFLILSKEIFLIYFNYISFFIIILIILFVSIFKNDNKKKQ